MAWLHDSAITINIPGVAVPKKVILVQNGGWPSLGTATASMEFQSNVRHFARIAMGEKPLFGCPIFVKIFFHFPIMPSWSQSKRHAALNGELFPTTKPDVDNCIKSVLDGLTKAVWVDDCQVTDMYARKRYSELPHTTIIVTPMGEETQESLL